jgi:hypothetical protein
MKQIFDWLREQIENKSNYEPVDYDYCDMACSGEQGFIAREDALDAINEAEAKWEAEYWACEECVHNTEDASTTCEHCARGYKDCYEKEDKCIWKCKTPTFSVAHGTTHFVDEVKYWKFCPYCGKPIKISEVE